MFCSILALGDGFAIFIMNWEAHPDVTTSTLIVCLQPTPLVVRYVTVVDRAISHTLADLSLANVRGTTGIATGRHKKM